MMEYTLRRTCKNCLNIDTFPLTKNEAAFGLFDSNALRKLPCSNCGSALCNSISRSMPTINKELLDVWGVNSDYNFLDQDEDIILAEYEYFPMLLDAIDESNYINHKVNTLIAST